ncbi:MAG TPA: hypothetical protein VL970_05110, partial [Candidatus Acidoferrales bacterium]|nr:hypothetical protein [Candidatus Acidoferrales bacterium]
PEKFGKIFELTMFDALISAVQDQEPGGITAGGRLLGDQFRRQIEMKIGGSHRTNIAVLAEKGQFRARGTGCE